MKKILLVFGTRPEAIKMAPLVKQLKCNPSIFELRVCVTAQHREILDQILKIFDINPDYDLDIMTRYQDLYDITTAVLQGLKSVINDFTPDLLLVHGDTTTTLAASLAAFYQQIDVGHVEAGLRTNNIYAPYPEEINRQCTTKIAKYHFAPTLLNKKNLMRENVIEENIIVTGNTVIDALMMAVNKIKSDKVLEKRIKRQIEDMGYPIKNLDNDRRLILVTGHRRENFGTGFLNICEALREIASRHPEIDIVYPVHLNPNVRKPVNKILSNISNVYCIEPLGYEIFVYLMSRSYFILTDSGGIQEEAPSLGKPTLVMRKETERPEAVEAGTVILVGTDKEKIFQHMEILINNKEKYQEMATCYNPYGDGRATTRIVDFLKSHL
ncbi:MAG: UDP-N-acetylglucosamine 2-epimerase (non-hydrolyzing) [Desulfobacula sp.]|uniref:non-hydrolyzing UDP-N-acetylglucosamine 2-epimerase n=1 Tax=Desulfobacula sp. TaxID=2593537 RepID=UPI0025C0CD57|nr:UDP-N-acetylglucosamine 2-epimerase (non-hydrolyzing) [Desulfobacula sp.]MCD4721463.1 UDP-N-acetylglucosamine 2-epimerase (non-hydrolyzing) [Desulfobacula sp.]